MKRFGLVLVLVLVSAILAGCPGGKDKNDGNGKDDSASNSSNRNGNENAGSGNGSDTDTTPAKKSSDGFSAKFYAVYENAQTNVNDRAQLAKAAKRASADDIEILLKIVLESARRPKRLLAIAILSKVPDIEKMEGLDKRLMPVLADEEKKIRMAVARFLDRILGSTNRLPEVVLGLGSDSVPEKKMAVETILKHLSDFKDKWVTNALRDELDQKDRTFHRKLLETIVAMKIVSRRAASQLASLFKLSRRAEKAEAIQWLAQYTFHDPDAIQRLRDVYDSVVPVNRDIIVKALSSLARESDKGKALFLRLFNKDLLEGEKRDSAETKRRRRKIVATLKKIVLDTKGQTTVKIKDATPVLLSIILANSPKGTADYKDLPATVSDAALAMGAIASRSGIDVLIKGLWVPDRDASLAASAAIRRRVPPLRSIDFSPDSPSSQKQIKEISDWWDRKRKEFNSLDN